MTGSLLNPVALALLGALGLLLFFKHKALGILLALLFLLADLFLFAALISEYREFHEPTQASHDLILYGSLYLGLNLLMALALMIKYAVQESGSRAVEPELS